MAEAAAAALGHQYGASQLAADEAQQLSALEAAHVLAVLRHALGKLSLLSVLTVDPSSQVQQLTHTVGEEITRMIEHQRRLEQRFHALVAAQPCLRALASKAGLHANQAELRDVSESLRQATKQLCRNLQDSPNVTENMAKVAAERAGLQALYAATSEAVALQASACPVVEAVLAAEQAQARMRALVESERSATGLVKALNSDLASEKVQHEEQVQEKRRALQALKVQLQQEKQQLAVQASFHGKELDAANQTSRRLQAAELARMQQELQQLQQQLEVEGRVRAAAVSFLAAKAASHQEAALSWHQRREQDGHGKERAIEALRAAHSRALDALAEAEARLREEQGAKQARDDSAREAADARAAQAALAARQQAAAATIQAAWRGFRARQAAKGERSKKKGGAVKGKKKAKK